MSVLAVGLALMRHAIQSETFSRVARYAVRQGTAALVREIQGRTRRRRSGTSHIS